MKKYKKIIMMLIWILPFFVQAATTDKEGPILTKFNISKEKATANEKINIDMNITDNVSGINKIIVAFKGATAETFNDMYFEAYIYDNVLQLPNNVAPGKYILAHVEANDNTNNYSYYQTEFCSYVDCYNSFENKNAVEWGNIFLEVEASGVDITPPILETIEINKEIFQPGEKVIFRMSANDDKTGIQTARVCISTEDEGGCRFVYLKYDEKESRYIGSYTLPKVNTTYTIDKVELIDNNQNSRTYYNSGDGKKEYNIETITFTVTGGIKDEEAPVLESITFEQEKIQAPYHLTLQAIVSDEESKVSHIYVTIKKKNADGTLENAPILSGTPVSCNQASGDAKTQLCEGTFEITQYFETGTYVITKVSVHDNAKKSSVYTLNPTSDEQQLELTTFEITEVFQYDLITTTMDELLITKIKQAKEDAKIGIDSTNNKIISKEVFEMIKGTNKTIYIETNGIIWIFNGKDITEPQDLDTTIYIEMLHNHELSSSLGTYIEKAVIINFQENQVLPGKALLEIKADYTIENYLNNETLYLYRYNELENKFVELDNNLNLSEDGYYEIELKEIIPHLLTDDEIKESEEIIIEKELPTISNPLRYVILGSVLGIVVTLVVLFSVITINNRKKKKEQK